MATRIGKEEGAALLVVELAALLHDIEDWKFTGSEETGPQEARAILSSEGVSEPVIAHVCNIIAHLSFKGAGVVNAIDTLEGKVVQDADRLDALGAIGIARAFAYGGHAGRQIHRPGEEPTLHQTKEAYMKNTGTTVNHFHEKLLLLKDRLHTKTAQSVAKGRHRFMEEFLDHFLKEWDGKD